ncbi:MAG TPA: DUF6299 family protein [Pedococcus sp.]|nr:DUF6299 family protein [Pedococcus sp.]
MRLYRSILSAAVALVLVPGFATVAQAAPPTNDTVPGATVLTALPTTIRQDTTQATTDATDAALNAGCGAPFTNASVWFRYTAPGDGGVVADMSASDYTGGFMVTEGDPSLGALVACGPEAVAFATTAGQTYYVAAFSDTSTNGGNLVVTFDQAPPPPEISVTVDPRGSAYKDGSARIGGTYSCTNADDFFSDIEGTLTQRVGRVKITGQFFVNPIQCDGTTHRWDGLVVSDNGLFRGGKSASVALGFACGSYECSLGYTEATVQLAANKK